MSMLGRVSRPGVRAGLAALVAVAGLAASVAWAADQAPADVIKVRQAGFKQIGGAFKVIGDQVKAGSITDRAALVAAAQKIDGLAKDVPTWFPKGSGPEAGVKTQAKAEIWSQPDKFQEVAGAFAAQTPKLVDAAKNGDINAVKDQLQATGKTCGACHQTFRAKES